LSFTPTLNLLPRYRITENSWFSFIFCRLKCSYNSSAAATTEAAPATDAAAAPATEAAAPAADAAKK